MPKHDFSFRKQKKNRVFLFFFVFPFVLLILFSFFFLVFLLHGCFESNPWKFTRDVNVEYRLRSSSIFRYLRGQSTRVSRKNYLCRTYATKKNQAFLYVSCRFVILANIILLGGC